MLCPCGFVLTALVILFCSTRLLAWPTRTSLNFVRRAVQQFKFGYAPSVRAMYPEHHPEYTMSGTMSGPIQAPSGYDVGISTCLGALEYSQVPNYGA